MNRIELKRDAKTSMRQAAANPYLCTFLFLMITSMLSVFSMGREVADLIVQSRILSPDDPIISSFKISGGILSIIVSILANVINAGYTRYCLKVSRDDQSASYGDLFSFFRYFIKVTGLFIVMNVLITLWTFLFIIPGIIASFRYSQAFFILAEDPDKGIMQCIRESKEMMVGYKMEYFVLQLSFFGWILLSAFTCMLAFIYVQPYMTVTMANFYNKLVHWNDQIVDTSYTVYE